MTQAQLGAGAAGMTAGLVATLVSNPLDVVTTRLMAVKKSHRADVGTLETISHMWTKEGPLSFYKGFKPNVLRIGTFNVIMWMAYEQIRNIGRDPVAAVERHERERAK
jgi:Mitochondrial carrier protein